MALNKKFGKIIGDGGIEYAPSVLVIGGKNVATNAAEKYIERGYFPIEKTEKPIKEGFFYTPFYVQSGEKIVLRWTENKAEEPQSGETATAEEIKAAIAEGVNSIDS